MWLFPVQYSLICCIGVALICCIVLYLVAIEVAQKRDFKKQLNDIVEKTKSKSIWTMNKDELYEHCRNCGLSEEDCKIAYFIVIERLKGNDLYNAICYSERQTKRKRKQILNKIQ